MELSHKTRLARAVVSILRPLIHVLIRNEFTHAELTELVRQTYVEVVDDAYTIPDQEMTVSRVAVLTGLSRKEVARLRAALNDNDSIIKQSPNRAQRVVQGWMNDAEFLDEKSRPKVLSVKGGQGSFIALVRRYSGDITYGAVLDELNLVGVTDQPDPETVRLINRAYIPRRDELEQVRILSVCVSDLFNTTVHNLDAEDDDKHFQRQVVYSGIGQSLAAKFREMSADRAATLIDELNTWLSVGRKSEPLGKDDEGKRVGIGIYYFENQSAKTSAKTSESDDDQS